MGARFAVTGGRAGWARTILTALGVGLGVTVLLMAASVPSAIKSGQARQDDRQPTMTHAEVPRSDTSVVVTQSGTEFRGENIGGVLLQADGDPADAAHPPGIERVPGPGQAYLSPALEELIDSEKLLAERFRNIEILGLIGDEGLSGPGELRYYLGSDQLTGASDHFTRVEGFGGGAMESKPLPPELVMLVIVMLVVLLMPIAVFIATAVRFGGETRDRRLAALRLVGADNAMTRRIAAGESLAGALLGLLLGSSLFVLGRSFAAEFTLYQFSAFPEDVTPGVGLAVLIVLLVPTCSVMVTLFALRKVAISPLGVAREGVDRGRRLWWRLVPLVLGGGMFLVLGPRVVSSSFDTFVLSASVILILVGLTAVLSWVVEQVVGRLRGGPLSWQLAIRRLQLNSGMAARAVSGLTVAVAGAIALQMLYGAVEADDRRTTGMNADTAQVFLREPLGRGDQAQETFESYGQVEGVNEVLGYVSMFGIHERAEKGEDGGYAGESLLVADCATLQQFINAESCREGDAYYAPGPDPLAEQVTPRPGDRYDIAPDATGPEGGPDATWWTVPQTLRHATTRENPLAMGDIAGLYVTPSAIDIADRRDLSAVMLLRTTEHPDVVERVRNAASVEEPGSGSVWEIQGTANSDEFNTIRNGLLFGAVVIMLLIASSMAVSTIEQLRERKRQLSVLVAFGTKRSTLGASVLWQIAIPVVLGFAVAGVGGVGLGLLLLRMINRPVAEWGTLLPLVGTGLGMIALVTLVSMPWLWRMMRPDGLRTE